MRSFPKISSRVLEQRGAEDAARKAAIEASLAKAPPPRVTKENWTDWNRYGWFGCPGNRRRTCSDLACTIGASCKRMAELGLAGDGSPLRRKERPRCGARTRKGAPCLAQGRGREKALPLPRRALNRPQDRRGQGTDRSSAAQAVGPVARFNSGPNCLKSWLVTTAICLKSYRR
jgi:hypothetical protein